MLNENAKKWVAALRSGKYKQTEGVLARIDGKETRYCCLGVACELAIKNGVKLQRTRETDDSGRPVFSFNTEYQTLPQPVQDWLGLKTETGDFETIRSLAELNDTGKKFKTIADIIESEPAGLFR